MNSLHETCLAQVVEMFPCQEPSTQCAVKDCELRKDGQDFMRNYPMFSKFGNAECKWLVIPQFVLHCHIKKTQSDAYTAEKPGGVIRNTAIFLKIILANHRIKYRLCIGTKIRFPSSLRYCGMKATVTHWVLASYNRTYSKDTVVAYVDRALNEIPSTVKEVSIWSDAPASQFKNRFIASFPKNP